MSEALPRELEARCSEICDAQQQGEPLIRNDYLLLALVTILVPAVLVVIGAAL